MGNDTGRVDGPTLRRLREARGFSQVELARRSDVCQQFISSIEWRQVACRLGTAVHLAHALDVAIGDLVCAPEPPNQTRELEALRQGLTVLAPQLETMERRWDDLRVATEHLRQATAATVAALQRCRVEAEEPLLGTAILLEGDPVPEER